MNAAVAPLTLTKDLLTGMEWSPAQVRELLHLAADVKAHPDRYRGALAGRFLALIFEKPSLRTRVTFEVGISSLGGASVFLDHTESKLGQRESISDVAKNLERWVQGIVARTFTQDSIDELAENASIPVINALSDRYHPCQALSDFFTLEERFGGLRGLKLAYVGDGNNVCHSLLSIGARAGAHIRVATPAGYNPDPAVVSEAKRTARETRGRTEICDSPEEAVTGAQAIYTDVWTSMGQEEELAAREAAFAGYQVNAALFAQAAPDAVFMHCLPAHRGSEVSEEVIDSPSSIVFDQAESRLHMQKAILLTLLN
ncbi:MAG TPA: ornithine carbamoyltransferase [Candidatus Sulfotelmatobacter sp.]|jgi:ornithine carbamoyltransferase|nr:ornithine carbamoyltransferase [Candidatus Sulfotelmatobacter sp.]